MLEDSLQPAAGNLPAVSKSPIFRYARQHHRPRSTAATPPFPKSLPGRLEKIQLKIDTKMEDTPTVCPASSIHVAPSFSFHPPINTASSFYIPPSFRDVHTVRKLPPIDSRTSASAISNSCPQTTSSPSKRDNYHVPRTWRISPNYC
jgi:hypothetical protein